MTLISENQQCSNGRRCFSTGTVFESYKESYKEIPSKKSSVRRLEVGTLDCLALPDLALNLTLFKLGEDSSELKILDRPHFKEVIASAKGEEST